MPEELDIHAAALLPEGDPLRLEWERKLVGMGPDAQAQWQRALAESRQWQASLRDTGLPEGFLSELLEIPATGEMDAAALLPVGDPIRAEWEERLEKPAGPGSSVIRGGDHPAGASGNVDQRETGGEEIDDAHPPTSPLTHWRILRHQSDTLRQALLHGEDVALPDSLQQRLLAIPRTRRWWIFSPPLRWAAAAVAAILLVVAGNLLWNQHLAAQDRRELNAFASLVVAQQATPPGPLVESDDARQVREVLERQGLPMPPIIVGYRRGGTQLTGGGVTTLNGERVFFTLWEWAGKRFTLYQFSPASFHLRENFITHDQIVSAAASGSRASANYRVWYWSEPEHHCGWALVTSGAAGENPFLW